MNRISQWHRHRAHKEVIEGNIGSGECVNAIAPSLTAIGFKVIDGNIGGASERNPIAAVISISEVVHDDPIDSNLVGMVSRYTSIRRTVKNATPDDFGIRGIIHNNAAFDDRSPGDVKRLAARHR